MERRVDVTGAGTVSPLGVGTEASWKGCIDGVSGVGPITKFDSEGFAELHSDLSVYYGAADTVVALGITTVSEMLAAAKAG